MGGRHKGENRNKVHWQRNEEFVRPACPTGHKLDTEIRLTQDFHNVTCEHCLVVYRSIIRPAITDLDALHRARQHCSFWLAGRCKASCNTCIVQVRV